MGIGVSFAGNFHSEPISPTEIASRMPLLSFFLGWLRFNPSHPEYGKFQPMRRLDSFKPQGRNVFFHRDFKNTACPGSKILPHLTQVSFVAPPGPGDLVS